MNYIVSHTSCAHFHMMGHSCRACCAIMLYVSSNKMYAWDISIKQRHTDLISVFLCTPHWPRMRWATRDFETLLRLLKVTCAKQDPFIIGRKLFRTDMYIFAHCTELRVGYHLSVSVWRNALETYIGDNICKYVCNACWSVQLLLHECDGPTHFLKRVLNRFL